FERSVSGTCGAVGHLISSPADEFTHHVAGHDLLDLKHLCLVDEHRHGQHVKVSRQVRSFAGGVIAAAGQQRHQQDLRHGKELERSFHCTFPCGRTAARALAASTAVLAARRRLSTAAQIQNPFSCDESRRSVTRTSSFPATFTLLGASSGVRATCTCSPVMACDKSPIDTGFSTSM